jgi:hypothetical protein
LNSRLDIECRSMVFNDCVFSQDIIHALPTTLVTNFVGFIGFANVSISS